MHNLDGSIEHADYYLLGLYAFRYIDYFSARCQRKSRESADLLTFDDDRSFMYNFRMLYSRK